MPAAMSDPKGFAEIVRSAFRAARRGETRWRTTIERLRYYEHQYLGALDFEDEQDYHRDMRRRHNLGPARWGIVVGLELEERDPVSGGSGPIEIYIRPGMALDGFGRELVLLEPFQIPPDPRLFQGLCGVGYVPIWITYAQDSVRRPASGWEQCLTRRPVRPGAGATSACSSGRSRRRTRRSSSPGRP